MTLPALSYFVAALAMSPFLTGCGGQGDSATLDLGGGLSMTAEGIILGATPLAAKATP
jgi:hypothetical protein